MIINHNLIITMSDVWHSWGGGQLTIHCNSEILFGLFLFKKKDAQPIVQYLAFMQVFILAESVTIVWLVLEICSVASFWGPILYLCLDYENVQCNCVTSISEVKIRNYYLLTYKMWLKWPWSMLSFKCL